MRNLNKFTYSVLVAVVFTVIATGCSNSNSQKMVFDPDLSSPQLIVIPSSIRTGVAVLMKDTKIEFKGKGFQPGDSVFISIEGVQKKGGIVSIPIADGVVADDGYFVAEVIESVKLSELLNGDVTLNEDMETVIVIEDAPVMPGVYQVQAKSMNTDKTAICQLTVEGPNISDRIKDFLGTKMGKIIKK